MPVEFLCPGCRATLSIARRKIGTGIDCPRCSGKIIVPDEFSARAEVVMARLERTAKKTRRGQRRPELTVHREAGIDLESPTADYASEPSPPGAEGTWRVIDDANDDAPPVVMAEPPPVALWQIGAAPSVEAGSDIYAARLRAQRRSWVAQAALMIAIAATAFVLGYALARSQNLNDSAASSASEEPVLIEGRITFTDSVGAPRPDVGALLLVVPQTPPEVKLRPLGINSSARTFADNDAEEFARAGGAMTRADDNGGFTLVVPKPGAYRLLWISRQQNRPDNQMPAASDLETLSQYFISPIDLIGLRRYALATQKLDAKTGRLEHAFR
jgi:DNA-directed RNA polymerase subunit RPC12/RpoP